MHFVTGRFGTIAALGSAQTLAWASSFYLPAMLATPIASDLALAPPLVFAAFSLSLVVSALVGPWTGRAIDRWGGRPVLIGTNPLFALGLVALGLAQGPMSLFAAWALIGLAMGSGLYDAAFATLVKLYGQEARNPITGITLIAGFASTVGWPLTALLEQQFGWRGACFAWAALHLVLGLPLNLSLPRVAAPVPMTASVNTAPADADLPFQSTDTGRISMVLAFMFAVTAFTSTAMAAHLPRLLQACGATLAVAVAVGALIGPAQVAGRLLEFGVLRRVHPLISARIAALSHALAAFALLLVGPSAAVLFALVHGAGNGILTIAKGTLPLVLFGPQGYGARQGWLTMPARVAQAMAPFLFGWVLDRWGSAALALSAALGLLAFIALMLLPTAKPPAGR